MMETLGQLIQKRLKALDMSRAELARAIGKSAAYIGDLANDTAATKRGHYNPSPETVNKLAQVLQVPTEEILTAIGYQRLRRDRPDGFDESDFALMYSRVTKLNAQQRRDFMIAWRMAKDMLDRLEQEKNGDGEHAG